MTWSQAGRLLPKEFNAVIEIPLGSSIKYELDKQSGLIKVDRLCIRRCIIPRITDSSRKLWAEDDDPLDVLVFSQEAVAPLTVTPARAIGLMTMLDSGKKDHKIIAVAVGDPEFKDYHMVDELPPHRLNVLRRFFQDYKQLEHKAVEVDRIAPAESAYPIVEDALHRYSEQRRRGFPDKRNAG